MHYSCILESAQRLSRYNNHQSKELIFRYTEKIFEKIQKRYWHLKKSVIYYRHSKGTEVLKVFKVYVWSFGKSFNDSNEAYEYAERLNKQGYEA